MANVRLVGSGEPAPHFSAGGTSAASFAFASAAGRYLVLCFYGSAADPHAAAALRTVQARPDVFNDSFAAFFGVSADPADEAEGRVASSIPGYRHFWDFDLAIARLYGAVPEGETARLLRAWVIVDPTMRVIASVPFREGGADSAEVLDILARQPPPERFAGPDIMAPVLFLPRVFTQDFCDELIALYHAHGGEESGVMRDINGKTTGVLDAGFKRRKDYLITDAGIVKQVQERVIRCIVPEIAKVHQFRVTRMERYLVACYAAEDGGHFSAHRDNTTRGTAHRRFAVSINLNEDFEGGEVCFPEYGPRSFKPPKGGAVVFSCSLLHRVSRVTQGVRFAFLPFLYDNAAAAIRDQNARYLAGGQEAGVSAGAGG